MTEFVQQPYGGKLVDIMATPRRAALLRQQSKTWPSLDLTQRQLCDLELLLNGGFSPLTPFMSQQDYESVLRDMRLSDGTLWPMPINLDVSEELAQSLQQGDQLALRDPEGVMLAALTITEIYKPDLATEAQAVFGTT